MLGSPCSPCCPACAATNYPFGDPAEYGRWLPSGSWKTGVTWAKSATDGDQWHFYGSGETSNGNTADWMNPCNWWIHTGATNPTVGGGLTIRANSLPPETATVFVHKDVFTTNAPGGAVTVARVCFITYTDTVAPKLLAGSTISVTGTWPASDGTGGAVFVESSTCQGTINGGATFNKAFLTATGIVNGGATFSDTTGNENAIYGSVNGGATFNNAAKNRATVAGGATFNDSALNRATVGGGAVFNNASFNAATGTVNGGATFWTTSQNQGTVNNGATFNNASQNYSGTVNGGATFNNTANNRAVVNGGAVFNGSSTNSYAVYGGAVFNGSSRNNNTGFVYDNATFNDAACTTTYAFVDGVMRFIVSAGQRPTCNGTAPTYSARGAANCGCD